MFRLKTEDRVLMRYRALLSLAVSGALAGCTSAGPSPLPMGSSAYAVVPEHAAPDMAADAVRPGDRLAIKVFGEPELTGENYVVDAGGYIQVPLVGELIVLQQSPRMIAAELERRLQTRYVKNASVTVSVIDRPLATFTVEGDVNQPGLFPAGPNTTLLSALAQARSPNKTAELKDVIVFRKVNGERAGGAVRPSGNSPGPGAGSADPGRGYRRGRQLGDPHGLERFPPGHSAVQHLLSRQVGVGARTSGHDQSSRRAGALPFALSRG